LGWIEQLQYALVLRGEKGAGKTRLLYQLMDLFTSVGYMVANFTLEIMKESDLKSLQPLS
jgi:tRNA A37 threonylcarbamoyladenosine biosynthesis protein TsaE